MAEKQVRAEALRSLSSEELDAQLQTLRRQVWEDRVKGSGRSVQHPHRIRQTKRYIARILTVLQGRDTAPQASGQVAEGPTHG